MKAFEKLLIYGLMFLVAIYACICITSEIINNFIQVVGKKGIEWITIKETRI